MKIKKAMAGVAVALAVGGGVVGCSSAADTASENLSTASENFEVERRIVFFNGITDTYLLTIEGRCSIESGDDTGVKGALEVTCKVGKDSYKKHYLGLSDNVSYFVEQLKAAKVSAYHYRVIFRPTTLVPSPEIDVK